MTGPLIGAAEKTAKTYEVEIGFPEQLMNRVLVKQALVFLAAFTAE